MAVNDFVRRSMQIVAGGIAQSTTDYFDNAVSFINDTKEVIDMGLQMKSDGVKKFNELKSSGILKKTRDWFYNEGGMFGDFDFDDDDFDAGFEIDSADSESGKKDSTPLSKDMMTDIAKKQTGAMYKAFGRQADLQIANTAEIISTINTRTAELTASVNNVNNTLIQIGKRLDLIVEWTSARTKKEEEAKREASILDYGGGISLSGVANKFKENMEDSMLGTFMSIGKTMLGSGMLTPEMVVSMILSQTLLDKKWDKLGGKSVNDIGEFLNDTVGEVIQNAMTKVLTSENEMLKSLFEGITSRNGSKNYQSYAVNQYNDKPAVFDGITRKSIVTVIPGYLNEILKAVNGGKGKTIDNKGNLSDTQSNHFVTNVAENYFRAGSVDWRVQDTMAERTGLTGKDVQNAMRALTGSWLWYMYASERTVLKANEVKDINAESTREVIKKAAELMTQSDPKRRSVAEWKMLYLGIVEQLPEYKYRLEIQHSAERANKSMVEGARGLHGDQYGYVNESVLEASWRKSFSDFNRGAEFHEPGAKPTQIGSNTNPNVFSTSEYVAGIFKRLNEGINVFVTGHATGKRVQRAPYKSIILSKTIQAVATNTVSPEVGTATPPSSAGTIGGMVERRGDNKLYNKAPDAIKELYDIPIDERTSDQKKQIREWESAYKKENKKSWRTLGGSVVNLGAFISDDSTLKKSVSDVLNDVLPETLKNAFSKGKEAFMGTKLGQQVSNKVNQIDEKVTNKVFGERITSWDGSETQRSGGMLQRGIDRVKSFGSSASDRLTDITTRLTPTSVLESRTKNLVEQYGGEKEIDPSDENALHMQVISNMINVAMSNGDMSNLDEQALYKEMGSIDDPDIQRQLKQSVIPLMKRNGKSPQSSGGSEPKSLLGKIGKLALGAFKLFLAPVIGYVKIVIFSVFNLIKYVGGGLLKFTKWGVMRGLRQIKFGTKSLVSSVKNMFKSLMYPVKKIFNGVLGVVNKLTTSIKSGLSKVWEGISSKFSDAWDNAKKKKEESGDKQSLGQKIASIPGTYSNMKQSLADKLSEKSKFMKGFTQAYRDRKEAEKKQSLEKQAEPTLEALRNEESGIPGIKTGVENIVEALGNVVKSLTGQDKDGVVATLKDLKSTMETESGEIQDAVSGDEGDDIGLGDSVSEAASDKIGSWGSTKESSVEVVEKTMDGGAFGGVEGAMATFTPNMFGGGAPGGGGAVGGEVATAGAAETAGGAMGGMMNILMGLSSIAITIVTSLEGFKALTSTVVEILTESLEPLNDAFHAIIKTLKPYVKELGGIIKQLAGFIVQIVEVIMDVIQPIMQDVIKPILEVLSPLLESIISCLTPLLKLVGIILKVVLAPLMGVIKFVLLPLLKVIGDSIQVIMGVLQIGFGLIMMGIGAGIAALGGIISMIGKIPGLGAADKLGSGIMESGQQMMTEGKDFVVQGGKSVVQGATNYILDLASFLTLGASDEYLGRNQEETKETKKIEATDDDIVQKTFANGDVTNIYNTYGGEYQRGMGGYLNMNQRGCGPIALADMYNRNQAGAMNARSLAGSMFGNGAYDPNRGTSVGGYIDTARSLGMNLTPGKVTQQSLKSASPTNPITVVGSGSDYGTRNGNNHFMNVIGTDSHGGAYVSNPLTGRIDRRPASTVAGSAVMGLYGSGDEPDGGYSFPDAVKEAFKKLKEEAAKILGLFSMEDKSDEDEVNDAMNAERNAGAMEQAKKTLGDDYDKLEKEAKDLAWADYVEKYPKRDGQTDDEYQAEFDTYWNAHSAEYLGEEKILEAARNKGKDTWQTIATTSDAMVEGYAGDDGIFKRLGDAYTKLDSAIGSLGSSGKSGSVSASMSGAVMDSFGSPAYTDLNMTDYMDAASYKSGHSLVHSYFGAKADDVAYSFNGNYYIQRNVPNSEGEGTQGTPNHWGIDLNFGKGSEGTPLFAITGGKVVGSKGGGLVETPGSNGGCGNNVQWEDSGGYYHWYMHMRDDPLVNVGEEIEPGQLLGYVGDTGDSKGAHLHYSVNKTSGSSGSNPINPLLYWDTFDPGGALEGNTNEEKIWAYLKNMGVQPHAIAGIMGSFQVESGNEPYTLEGYYAFGDGSRTNAVAKEAMQNYDTLNDYTLNYLFPYYARIGKSIDQEGYHHSDGNYYPGLGLAQWTGERTKKLSQYTVEKGYPWSDLAGQLDYLKYEVENVPQFKSALTAMNNSNDVNKSTEIWLSDFERNPGDALSQRQAYAKEFYERFKNWTSATKKTFHPTGGSINSLADARMKDNYDQIKTRSGKNSGTVFTRDGDDLNMRADKSVDSSVLIRIPNGEHIDNLEASGSPGWYKATWSGKTGYVSSEYIVLDHDDANDFNYSGSTNMNDQVTMEDHLLSYAKGSVNAGSSNTSSGNTGKSSTSSTSSSSSSSSSSGKGTTNNVTYKAKIPNKNGEWDGDTFGLGANDVIWDPSFYTNSDNFSSFMVTDDGSMSAKPHGIFTNLAAASEAISKSYKNKDKYWDNLLHATNNDNLYAESMSTKLGEVATHASDWINMRQKYITKRDQLFPGALQSVHYGLFGSGDADTTLAEDQFWNDYLGWNNRYNTNISRPTSDGSDTMYSTGAYYDTETGTTVVNNYAVTRAEDKATDARIRAILANTYNVRSESMEALLNAILDELKRRKGPGSGNNTNGSTKLFDERIPAQVTKLSIG